MPYQCTSCERSFETEKGLKSHLTQVHDPTRIKRDRFGVNAPMYGKKGKNKYAYINWESLSFDELSWEKKKKRLFNETNYSCQECGYNKRRPDNGYLILEIHHIDGNHKNNSRENLQVLCPNCHALTPNHGNHGGKGNKVRSTRHDELVRHRRYRYSEIERQKREAYFEQIKRIVLETHASGEIDYSQFGWVHELTLKLNDGTPDQRVSRLIMKLMPDFYHEFCFRRNAPKLSKAAQKYDQKLQILESISS